MADTIIVSMTHSSRGNPSFIHVFEKKVPRLHDKDNKILLSIEISPLKPMSCVILIVFGAQGG
jgi:hypothetical protein